MANGFQLSLRQDDEKVRLFTEGSGNASVDLEEISDEDLQAAEREKINAEINEFFNLSNGIEEFIELYQDDLESVKEQTKDEFVKTEELKKEEDDPLLLKKFEAEKTVFAKKKLEDMKEKNKDSYGHSKSTDYVVDDSKSSNRYSTTSAYGNRSTSGTGSLYGGGYKTSGTGAANQNNNQKNKEPRKLNEDVAFVASKVQDVAMQKVHGWREKQEENVWGKKPSFFKKVKRFMRSKKAKILLKTGMLMTLQLGMAMVGKKYEFDGMGQMAMFLGMMMGVFYLTRELAEDGFDPRGFGIL